MTNTNSLAVVPDVEESEAAVIGVDSSEGPTMWSKGPTKAVPEVAHQTPLQLRTTKIDPATPTPKTDMERRKTFKSQKTFKTQKTMAAQKPQEVKKFGFCNRAGIPEATWKQVEQGLASDMFVFNKLQN